MTSERAIEEYLRSRVRDLGGTAYKFTSPGRRSVPDRLVILPGRTLFVEVKAPGKLPTKAQEREIDHLRRMGNEVLVINSKEQVDGLIREIRAARISS